VVIGVCLGLFCVDMKEVVEICLCVVELVYVWCYVEVFVLWDLLLVVGSLLFCCV